MAETSFDKESDLGPENWCWSWNFNTLATWCEELTHLKKPWCWERMRAGGEGDHRGWDGWMTSLTWGTWIWVTPGVGDGQGSLACRSPWDRKELDTVAWTEVWTINQSYSFSTFLSSSSSSSFFCHTQLILLCMLNCPALSLHCFSILRMLSEKGT